MMKASAARKRCSSITSGSTDLRIKVARIFNTYGPRMHPNDGRVVSNFIMQALKNEPITLYGDGNQTRSFCYVSDLVDGLIRLMGSPDDVTGPINLGNPGEFSMRELAELVVTLTGSRSKIEYRPLPMDDPRQRQPDISRAKKTLGWEPKIRLEEGLRKPWPILRNFYPKAYPRNGLDASDRSSRIHHSLGYSRSSSSIRSCKESAP